jgi:choice-of-anchor B domain-containing protein
MCRFLSIFVFIYTLSILNVLGQGSALNAKLLSNVPFTENSSGAWGYEKDGIKYALIGVAKKTSIFSLEDPKKPILRYSADGVQSIWRELRGYKNHIYVSIDQGQDGVTIIDMTKAPETIKHLNFKPRVVLGSDTITLNTCHNLFIDEKGFLYLTGCNIGVRGVLIYDLNDNPNNPTYKGMINTEYSHDVFVRGDTLYSSEINKGFMTLYDVSDKANPKFIVNQTTSRNFTHNIWPSDDGKYAFTTDERGGAFVDAYDISDLTSIRLLDKFRTINGEIDNTIPHNAYYYNGYLVVSYYTDGVRILDVHKPDNMIEVAYYDTWESPTSCHNGFSGCWGVFPYTGSNIIYASDINNGLYIIDVDYKRACYLEGKITDINGIPVNNVNVQIISDQINKEFSDVTGSYKTGQVFNGKFKVRFTHPNYETIETEANLENGVITILNVVMKRRVPVNASVNIMYNSTTVNANIVLVNDFKDEIRFSTLVNNPTNRVLNVADYEVYVTKWGYKNFYQNKLSILPIQNNKFELALEKGYEDNFETDLGWTVSSSQNTAGQWTRAIPRKVLYLNNQVSNVGNDSEDQGTRAFVTGNGLPGAACDDVDNGVTSLISPPMFLKNFIKPKLNYDAWFFNDGSAPLNDTLIVKLKNKEKEVIVDKIFATNGDWLKVRDIEIEKFINIDDSLQVIIEASDLAGSGHIVEAGFDNFFISQSPSSNVEISLTKNRLEVYPNPVLQNLIIRTGDFNVSEAKTFDILDGMGRVVMSGNLDFHTFRVDVSNISSGVYFLKVSGFEPTKFIKI